MYNEAIDYLVTALEEAGNKVQRNALALLSYLFLCTKNHTPLHLIS